MTTISATIKRPLSRGKTSPYRFLERLRLYEPEAKSLPQLNSFCQPHLFLNSFRREHVSPIKTSLDLTGHGKSILCQESTSLSERMRYIHLNPIWDIGLTATEVGKYLGLSKSAVSLAATRVEKLIVDQFLSLKDNKCLISTPYLFDPLIKGKLR